MRQRVGRCEAGLSIGNRRSGRFARLLRKIKMFNVCIHESGSPTDAPFPGTPSPWRDRHCAPAAACVRLVCADHRGPAKAALHGGVGDGDARESEFHGVQAPLV